MAYEKGGVVEFGLELSGLGKELRLHKRKTDPRRRFSPEDGKPLSGFDEIEIVSHEVLEGDEEGSKDEG